MVPTIASWSFAMNIADPGAHACGGTCGLPVASCRSPLPMYTSRWSSSARCRSRGERARSTDTLARMREWFELTVGMVQIGQADDAETRSQTPCRNPPCVLRILRVSRSGFLSDDRHLFAGYSSPGLPTPVANHRLYKPQFFDRPASHHRAE